MGYSGAAAHEPRVTLPNLHISDGLRSKEAPPNIFEVADLAKASVAEYNQINVAMLPKVEAVMISNAELTPSNSLDEIGDQVTTNFCAYSVCGITK